MPINPKTFGFRERAATRGESFRAVYGVRAEHPASSAAPLADHRAGREPAGLNPAAGLVASLGVSLLIWALLLAYLLS